PLLPALRRAGIEPADAEEDLDRADVMLLGKRRLGGSADSIVKGRTILAAHTLMRCYRRNTRRYYAYIVSAPKPQENGGRPPSGPIAPTSSSQKRSCSPP